MTNEYYITVNVYNYKFIVLLRVEVTTTTALLASVDLIPFVYYFKIYERCIVVFSSYYVMYIRKHHAIFFSNILWTIDSKSVSCLSVSQPDRSSRRFAPEIRRSITTVVMTRVIVKRYGSVDSERLSWE